MLILISRVSAGYYVDALSDRTGVRVLTPQAVTADEAFCVACDAGATENEAFEALEDADRRWRRLNSATLLSEGHSPRLR